jgi:hypothetical protein
MAVYRLTQLITIFQLVFISSYRQTRRGTIPNGQSSNNWRHKTNVSTLKIP